MEKERGALRLTAPDAAAVRLGLRPGMALTEARALVPNLLTLPHDAAADARLLHACAEACERFTPLVAIKPPYGVMLDITGSAHLFGGEVGLMRQARARLADHGLTSAAAIAGTPHAAWAFARYRRGSIVAPGDEEALARDLPLAALEATPATLTALMRAGFHRLGDLAERPSNMLTARFGVKLSEQLARILGREDIRITPLRPPPELMAEKHFPEPIGLMAHLLAALERLAGDLARRFEAHGTGGRAFEASFFRADGAVRRVMIDTASPMRDPAALLRLLRLKLDTLADPLDPGFGFDAVRLAVLRAEPMPLMQSALDGSAAATQGEGEFAALIDRLVARFGREAVRRFIARETHDPLRAGGSMPYLTATEAASFPPLEPGEPPARPLTLFDPPQMIEALAEVPDGPPLRFRWRRVLHEVTRAEGPERIAPEWWRYGNAAPATRDYYRIENAEGHRFWVFREGFYEDSTARPRWFMHGLFA